MKFDIVIIMLHKGKPVVHKPDMTRGSESLVWRNVGTSFRCSLLGMLLGMVLPSAQAAVVVPDATFESAVAGGMQVYRTPGSYSGTWCSPYNSVCATDHAAVSAAQVLTVSGASAGSDNLGANGNSQAQMTYYFAVEGPANIPVPLRISGLIDLSVQGPTSWAIGRILYGQNSIGQPGGFLFNACAADDLYVCQAYNVHLDNSSTTQITRTLDNALFRVSANSLQNVWLSVGGLSSSAGGPGGSYRGFVDPVIVIDPVFLASNPGYSIKFSGNLSAVPLPGAGGLLAGGMALLAARSARRRMRS